MENLFTIPLGGKNITILIGPLARRSYQMKLGQVYFKNQDAVLPWINSNPGIFFYLCYVEYCQVQKVDPLFSQVDFNQFCFKHGNEPDTLQVLTEIMKRYAELERDEPTVINNVFA